MLKNNTPQISVGDVCREAFGYWWNTLLYQMLFGIIFFTIFIGIMYSTIVQLGIWEQYLSASEKILTDRAAYISEINTITQSEAYGTLYWVFIGVMVVLYPLNLGFFKIYRKMDLGEPITFSDFFAGYQGVNFFIYTGFFLFWISIYNILFPTLFLPVIWVLVTLFSAPLSFFMNKSIFQGISISVKALRIFFIEILICSFVAFVFKYLGVLTFFGALFTFSFWNAMIYALYKNIFTEVK